MVSMKLVTAETCKEGNRVVNVKLESAMNTFETSVNVKMAQYSAEGPKGAGLYSGKTLFVYSGNT